jgi:hypothetical protein
VLALAELRRNPHLKRHAFGHRSIGAEEVSWALGTHGPSAN